MLPRARPATIFEGEQHFATLTQLTFGLRSVAPQFDADGTEIVFESTRGGFECDQTFRMDADGHDPRLVSGGLGRTADPSLFPTVPKLLFSSSHGTVERCPTRPASPHGLVRLLSADLDLYVAAADGSNPRALAPHRGYDAEAVVSPSGGTIVFTSTRSGDVELWAMRPDGTELRQLTDALGFDGDASFSPDGAELVYAAHHPREAWEIEDYRQQLREGVLKVGIADIRLMNADGSDERTILSNGAANLAPVFHPDGTRIVFASNVDDPKGENFDLYMIRSDGSHLARLTYNPGIDTDPVFSSDGTRLAFASRRGEPGAGTNIFVAQWTEQGPPGVEAKLEGAARLEPKKLGEVVGELASPRYAGRAFGTPELEAAGARIAEWFEAAGLEPAGDDGFRQRFSSPTAATLTGATLTVDGADAVLGEDFRPFSFSSSGRVAGEAVFVGYGITSAAHAYDDYGDVDVEGKVAVAFRARPRRNAAEPLFDESDIVRASLPTFKAMNARHRGARALLLIETPLDGPRASGPPPLVTFDGSATNLGIPVAHVSWEAATRLFGESKLRERYDTIDRTGGPASMVLDRRVDLAIEIATEETEVANIVGVRRGTQADRIIVVGAHYDHLGFGGDGSLAGAEAGLHPGADDNASGVAVLVELAEAVAALDLRTTVYFVAFTGEERGLQGSGWFVDHPPFPVRSVEAMLNFDMVGRYANNGLTVFGTGTASGLIDVVRRAQAGLPLDLTARPRGSGTSDHQPFLSRQIPVLHYFTGLHDDYHRPSDTADKVDLAGMSTIAAHALRVLHILANREDGATWNDASTTSGPHTTGALPDGDVYFGSIPELASAGDGGVPLSGARADSPAARAGIQPGDVLVKFGADDIANLRDYGAALRRHAPGEAVEVVVSRNGRRITLRATLGAKAPSRPDTATEPVRETSHENSAP